MKKMICEKCKKDLFDEHTLAFTKSFERVAYTNQAGKLVEKFICLDCQAVER